MLGYYFRGVFSKEDSRHVNAMLLLMLVNRANKRPAVYH